MNRKTMAIAAGALLLAACNEDDSPVADNSVPAIAAAQIASKTNDSSLPLDLNTLDVSDAGTDETSVPSMVE